MSKLLTFLLLISFNCYSQVSINSNPFSYTQDFGATDITSWSNNSTYLGWYANNSSPSTLHNDITSAIPTNTGSFYTYECNGSNDQKIGSRASGTIGTIYYGIRFTNNSGITLTTISISVDYLQLSLAQNGNVPNNIDAEYLVTNSFSNISTDLPLQEINNFYWIN